jgi:uncharacterized protein with PIN domain
MNRARVILNDEHGNVFVSKVMSTLLDSHPPRADRLARLARDERIILTRSTEVRRALPAAPLIFIQSNAPDEQFDQVMRALTVAPDELHPMTRCAACNQPLDSLAKSEALGRVPDYVWQRHEDFKACPECRRVYWPGSHVQRWRHRMARWLGP